MIVIITTFISEVHATGLKNIGKKIRHRGTEDKSDFSDSQEKNPESRHAKPQNDRAVSTVQGTAGEEEEEAQPVEEGKEKEKAENLPEPLWQLITAFSRSARTEATAILEADFLYISYATIMGQVDINRRRLLHSTQQGSFPGRGDAWERRSRC